MGRPRTYDTSAVVEAARDLFWEQGYEVTSVSDLEDRTGLGRSSLYQAFGSKHELFEVALRRYVQVEIEGMLSGLRQAGAGLEAIKGFFAGRARAFREDPSRTPRGCLMVNSIAELATRDPGVGREAAAHWERLHQAFAAALTEAAARGELNPKDGGRRARLLASATMGVFLTARIDPVEAADVCDAVAAEVASWRLGSRSGRSRRQGTQEPGEQSL